MNGWQRISLGGLLLVHLALVPGLTFWASQQPDMVAVVIPLGIGLAQAALASLGVVCLKKNLAWRCASALVLTGVSWLTVMLALRRFADVHASVVPMVGAMGPFLVLLIMSGILAVVGPLGPWRIILPDRPGKSSRQFTLRSGMLVVAAACIALAVARAASPPWNGDLLAFRPNWDELLLPLSMFVLFISINGLLLLPIFESLFLYEGKNRVLMVVLLIGVPIYGTLMTVAQMFVVDLLLQALWGFNTSQLLTIGGTVIAMRATGVRFERSPPLGESRSGELPPGEGGERLHDAGPASTIAAAGETSPLAIDR